MKLCIHFAHGNGFPSPCYRQLFLGLQDEYTINYIDMLGHNPKFPVTNNWHNLVLEVIDSIERQCSEPVIAVGHSLGGVLNTIACIERPDLFKAVVLLDSPMLGSVKSNVIRLAKSLGIIDRVTPAKRTRGRRQHWQNKEVLLNYLKSRALFKHFDQRCLHDYIDYGLQLKEDGYYLRFDKAIEYLIYRTLPHQLPQYHKKLKKPAAIIYGNKSDIVDRYDLKNMKKNYSMISEEIQGDHLFVFESPTLTVQAVKSVINAIL